VDVQYFCFLLQVKISCGMCHESYHEKCVNYSSSNEKLSWSCAVCTAASASHPEEIVDVDTVPEKAKKPMATTPRRVGRPSKNSEEDKPKNKKVKKVILEDSEDDLFNDDEEVVPESFHWTPNQVHAYFQMFVPSHDAKVILDHVSYAYPNLFL